MDDSALAAAFDRSGLMQRCAGNQDLACQLAALFLDNADKMLAAVVQAVELGDAPALERSAHGLKGMVANFDAATAVAHAWELEKLGRSRTLENARPQLEKLQQSIATLSVALQRTFDI